MRTPLAEAEWTDGSLVERAVRLENAPATLRRGMVQYLKLEETIGYSCDAGHTSEVVNGEPTPSGMHDELLRRNRAAPTAEGRLGVCPVYRWNLSCQFWITVKGGGGTEPVVGMMNRCPSGETSN